MNNFVTELDGDLFAVRDPPSADDEHPPMLVDEVFRGTAERFADVQAVRWEVNPTGESSEWTGWTWKEYYNESRRTARALIAVGLQPHQCVCIMGLNRKEWFLGNNGAVLAGGVSAGIYPNNTADAAAYIADHCRAPVILVESDAHLKLFSTVLDSVQRLKVIVQFGGEAHQDEELKKKFKAGGVDVYGWDEFLAMESKTTERALDKVISAQKPGHCASLIYTSGTTGRPKAVMLCQDQLTWIPRILIPFVLEQASLDNLRTVSYLPLSHVAAQMLDIYGPLVVGATVHFARPDALKGSLVHTLRAVRPTAFLGVPRVWEKMMEKMLSVGRSKGPVVRFLSTQFKRFGSWLSHRRYEEGQLNNESWILTAIESTVFGSIRQALGLDQCKIFASGAAPLSMEVQKYFLSLCMPIHELYGMSESGGPTTLNTNSFYKAGTVGVKMANTGLRTDDESGEICFRGRHIMMGYLFNEEATRSAIDEDGWLHSGDIGKIDEDGFLSITGRLKELIITAGGENVAPVLIEDEIKKHVGSVVSNVMVIGDQKKFLSCLVTLKVVMNPDDTCSHILASDCKAALEEIGSSASTVEEAMACAKVNDFIVQGLKAANKNAVSRAATVQKHTIIATDFTVSGGELTPTLKLKRPVVAKKYVKEIEAMYAE